MKGVRLLMTTTSSLCDELRKTWVPLFQTREAYFSADVDKYREQPWKEKAEAGEVSIAALQRSVERVKVSSCSLSSPEKIDDSTGIESLPE